MIEDNNIKTTVSPFAMRTGEIKVFDGKDGYVSMNQILQKINIGQINDIHFKILELINKFEFLTSRQLFQLLTMDKVDIKDQEKFSNPQVGRVYSINGISACLNTFGGGSENLKF